MKAVITGDLIGSSNLDKDQKIAVLNTLDQACRYLESECDCRYVIYRGDSMQGYIEQPEHSLRHTLYLKSVLKALRSDENSRSSLVDMRIAIGIGDVSFIRDRLIESDGEAFQYSGRMLDEIKKTGSTMAVKTSDKELDRVCNTAFELMDEILMKWSFSAAEVVRELILGYNEIQISERLNISQPAVNSRKKHAGWDAIHSSLLLFDLWITKKFSGQ